MPWNNNNNTAYLNHIVAIRSSAHTGPLALFEPHKAQQSSGDVTFTRLMCVSLAFSSSFSKHGQAEIQNKSRNTSRHPRFFQAFIQHTPSEMAGRVNFKNRTFNRVCVTATYNSVECSRTAVEDGSRNVVCTHSFFLRRVPRARKFRREFPRDFLDLTAQH